MKLFPKDKVVGIFRGFSEGGLEFHADLVLPYRPELQASPMHGQFVVVALESDDEGVLGRITSISAQGRLASGAGEDYSLGQSETTDRSPKTCASSTSSTRSTFACSGSCESSTTNSSTPHPTDASHMSAAKWPSSTTN